MYIIYIYLRHIFYLKVCNCCFKLYFPLFLLILGIFMCKGKLAIFKLLLHNALKEWYSVFIPFVSLKSGNLFFNLPYSFQWFKAVIVGPEDFDDETLHGTLMVLSTRLEGLEDKILDNIVRKIVQKIDWLPMRLEHQVNWTIGKPFKRLVDYPTQTIRVSFRVIIDQGGARIWIWI